MKTAAVLQKKDRAKSIEPALSHQVDSRDDIEKKRFPKAGVPLFLQCAAVSFRPSPHPVQRQPDEEDKAQRLQAKPIAPSIQREVLEEEEQAVIQTQPLSVSRVQRLCSACEGELRTKSPSAPKSTARAFTLSRIQSLGEGSPMPTTVRARVEPLLGTDLSHVRVHADASANDAARALQAKAFTHKHHISLGAGQRADDTGLMAHEATHVVQQGAAPTTPGVQRDTQDAVIQRYTHPAPPAPEPLPAPGTFAPLSPAELAGRQRHGMSTDTGTMTREIERTVFPSGGTRPPCTPLTSMFVDLMAISLSSQLMSDMPSLTPTAAPDPMAVAQDSADAAMPIIHSHYSPYAPSVTSSAFMSRVSRKPANYGDPIRNTVSALSEFLSWYAGARSMLRSVRGTMCVDMAFWNAFAAWIRGASFAAAFTPLITAGKMLRTPDVSTRGSGTIWDSSFAIRERSALYDTYRTTVQTGGITGSVMFGLAFELFQIPHTITHEAMHSFMHDDFGTQIDRLENIRLSKDIFTEGFAEYLARGVRDLVVDAIQARTPPTFASAVDATRAKTVVGYPHYYDKTVALRNILYRHGQDGEDAIRRAFFLGEGWRFGLLEATTPRVIGSPIETDRPIPTPVDVHFNTNSDAIVDAGLLDPVVAYVTTRSIATIEVIGRSDPQGRDIDNEVLGQDRAEAVKRYLSGRGIDASRISTRSRGERDQIAGGWAMNRRATVIVSDPRNAYPGTGRPAPP